MIMDLTNTNRTSKRKQKPAMDLSTMVYGKVPPQARDLEEAVLGACMLQRGAIDMASDVLKPEAFYVDAHQRIFNAMTSLSSRSQPIDMLTVVEELRTSEELDLVGGPFYVTKLTNAVTSSAHIEYHAKIIMQKFIQRELIRIGGEMIADAYEDSTDVFDLLEQAENNLYGVTVSNLRKDYSSIDSALVEVIQRIEDMRKKDESVTGVTSGFHSVDRITHGWQNTDLIIIAARPAVGKTAFALNLARNAALHPSKPTAVAVFSLEMSTSQLMMRMLATESEIALNKIQIGRMEEYEMEQLYKRGIQKLAGKGLFIDDTAGLNVFELRAKCRRMKSKHDIGLIVIDYLQLMSGDGKAGGNREQEISKISRELKKLAKDLNVPIIALSQLSREIEKRKEGNKVPQLSDLRESGAIEQDADMVCFLYGHDEQEWAEDADLKSKRYLKVSKHRHGELDKIDLRFLGHVQKFVEEENYRSIQAAPAGFKPVPKETMPFIPVGNNNDKDDDLPF